MLFLAVLIEISIEMKIQFEREMVHYWMPIGLGRYNYYINIVLVNIVDNCWAKSFKNRVRKHSLHICAIDFLTIRFRARKCPWLIRK